VQLVAWAVWHLGTCDCEQCVQMAKIYIIYYSLYGHIYQMAQKMKVGVDKVPGCEGVLFQVCKTLEATRAWPATDGHMSVPR
jgi:hypothetical protein